MSESLLTENDKLLLSSGVEDSLLDDFVDPDDHRPKIVAIVPGSRAGTTVVGKLNLFGIQVINVNHSFHPKWIDDERACASKVKKEQKVTSSVVLCGFYRLTGKWLHKKKFEPAATSHLLIIDKYKKVDYKNASGAPCNVSSHFHDIACHRHLLKTHLKGNELRHYLYQQTKYRIE